MTTNEVLLECVRSMDDLIPILTLAVDLIRIGLALGICILIALGVGFYLVLRSTSSVKIVTGEKLTKALMSIIQQGGKKEEE